MSNSVREEDDLRSASRTENNEDEPVIRKIFIGNVNSYQGKAIAKKLPDIKHRVASLSGKSYEVYGSLEVSDEIDNEIVENYAPRILDRKKPSYLQSILDCDVIVYDIGMHGSEIGEAQKVLDLLDTRLKFREPVQNEPIKYFILISIPLVWANTPALEGEDSTPSFSESDYRKRRPHPCYMKHQYLEREVMNAQNHQKGNLRTIVLCPGVTYGARNDVFHYIFKMAFYNKGSIDIFQPNLQEPSYIPMIYINDFAQVVFHIIESFPSDKLRYIIAVQPNPMSMLTFGTIIAKSLGGNPMKVKIATKEEILQSSKTLISQRIYHYLSLNLRMTPTFFKDFPFSFTEENYENMGNTLADEYRRERNLLPIKIIVDGPPCAGKTTLCKALAEQYEIHYVHPESAIYYVSKSLEEKVIETKSYLRYLSNYEPTDAGVEAELEIGLDRGREYEELRPMRKLSAEVIKIAGTLEEELTVWEAELADLNEYIHTMRESDQMDIEYVKKCLLKILSSKPCSENQGYVVDGFPFDYKQVAEIFPSHLFHGNMHEEKKFQPTQASTNGIIPQFFIVLAASDDILCKRAMSLSENEALETKNTEEELIARLAKYRERTEEDVACSNYFSDNGINPILIKITLDMTSEQLLEIAKKQIGPPHTYPLTRSQMEDIARHNLKVKSEAEEMERKKREQLVREETAAKERNLQEWTHKFEHLKRQEQEILEAKSLPLRSYLCKYVLPTLTEGLLKVAETKPDDPIVFLAEYLFKCNPSGHVLDPAYSEESKRLLLSLDCDIEKMLADRQDEDKSENLECADSFIVRHVDDKGSDVSLEKKHPRARKADKMQSSSVEISKPLQRKPIKKNDGN